MFFNTQVNQSVDINLYNTQNTHIACREVLNDFYPHLTQNAHRRTTFPDKTVKAFQALQYLVVKNVLQWSRRTSIKSEANNGLMLVQNIYIYVYIHVYIIVCRWGSPAGCSGSPFTHGKIRARRIQPSFKRGKRRRLDRGAPSRSSEKKRNLEKHLRVRCRP